MWKAVDQALSLIRNRLWNPKVSIAISTLNRHERLERTLESLNNLSYDNFEVVVVNGPSTDETEKVLERWRCRIKVGSCPEMRLGRSRNIALSLTSGDIIAFLDDDAIPESDWLTKIVKAYNDPSVGAVGGFVYDVPLERILWKVCTSTRLGDVEVDQQGPIDAFNKPGADPFLYLAGCNSSVRRSAIMQAGGFNELQEFAAYDDVDICARIIDLGFKIRVLDDALVRHYRAVSRFRDENQVIKDFYPLVHSQAVFALQTNEKIVNKDRIFDFINQMADRYRAVLYDMKTKSLIDQDYYETLMERISQAVVDGVAAGLKNRQGYSDRGLKNSFKRFVKAM